MHDTLTLKLPHLHVYATIEIDMFTHTPHAHVRATFEASAAAETRSASCRHSPAIISDLIYARIRYVRVCVCVCVICVRA
jgi:hypothetical protein